MLFRRIIYVLILVAALLFAGYYLQPLKTGKGADDFTKYELDTTWPQLPHDLKLGNPTGIGIDTNQNIVVFHRAYREWPLLGSMPRDRIKDAAVLILDREGGKILNSWGADIFIMPHGLTVDDNDNVWVTDVGLHQVFKFTHNGKLIMKLGKAGVSGSDKIYFNKPTDIAVAKDGSFYVSDGYGNSRVVKFSPTGKYLFEWGTKGSKEGQFNIPHGIDLDDKGNVYVADRENNRIQVFDSSGQYLKQYADKSFGNMCSIAFGQGGSKFYAVDDLSFFKIRHRGSDVFIFDTSGNVKTRFGRSSSSKGSVGWYHDIAVDKEENIYIGDIIGNKILKFKEVAAKQ